MDQPVDIYELFEFPGYYFRKVGEGAYGEVFLGQSESGNNMVVKKIKND